MLTYLAVYLGAMSLALLVTPLIIHFAHRMNCLDIPCVRKVHASAVPRVGGIAIVFASLTMTITIFALHNKIGNAFRLGEEPIVALLIASLLIFFTGLVDDLCELRARQKLIFQILAAVIICASGARITEIGLTENYIIRFGWMSWPITILWIVGITNAVNLIDGLDGLAAGLSAITCAVIAAFAIYTNQPIIAVLMLALLGSLTGFLFFNFNPAKIFMGDCGSLFLGFVLASSSVICVNKTTTIVGLAMPMLALGVPIFDTFFSMLRRLLERRSLFAPDKSHIHHRLLEKGLKHHQAVILIYIITLVVAGMGMFMLVMKGKESIIMFASASFLLVLVFRAVGAVRLIDSVETLANNFAIAQQTNQEKRKFENVQLFFMKAESFSDWWNAVCDAGKELDFLWLSMNTHKRDGTIEALVWRPAKTKPNTTGIVHVTLPVAHRREGTQLKIEIGIRINGSLESAGRRAALFARLIDEFSLKKLVDSQNSKTISNQRIYNPIQIAGQSQTLQNLQN